MVTPLLPVTPAPTFVVAADLHFDEYGAWRYRDIRGDAAYGLSQVVDYCLEHSPGALWLLGDILNRPKPGQAAVKEFCDQMDRLRHRVPVYYILGDHDGHQDWPALHPWPHHMDGVSCSIGRLVGYGLDYRPRGTLQAHLEAIPPGVRILFTHQKWAEFVHESAQGALSEVPSHVRYVLTGDYHACVHGVTDAVQEVWSPGSLIATKVDDQYVRHFIVGHERFGKLECEFVPLKSRPIHRFWVKDLDDLTSLLGVGIARVLTEAEQVDLPLAISRPIVDISYFTDVPHVGQLRTLADRCFLFLKPKDRTRHERMAANRAGLDLLTEEAALARHAPPGTPGHAWALRLLHAPDRDVEWKAIVAETEKEMNHAEVPR